MDGMSRHLKQLDFAGMKYVGLGEDCEQGSVFRWAVPVMEDVDLCFLPLNLTNL